VFLYRSSIKYPSLDEELPVITKNSGMKREPLDEGDKVYYTHVFILGLGSFIPVAASSL